jgi:aspartyl/asparaginyl-tRNA synthetase
MNRKHPVIAAPQFGSAPHWQILIRDEWCSAIARLTSALVSGASTFFQARRYLNLPFPPLTHAVSSPSGLGSDSKPVAAAINGNVTYLADSMQFYLELGCRITKGNVFYISPSFRGERPDVSHLSQFIHVECEGQGDLTAGITLASQLVDYLSRHLLLTCRSELESIAGTVEHIDELLSLKADFPCVKFQQMVNDLGKSSPDAISRSPSGFDIVTRAGESIAVETYGTAGALWITNYPWLSVPFYQAKAAQASYAKNADLILGSCETVGCGERWISGADIRSSLSMHGVNGAPYEWYAAMKDEMPMRTFGFGLGIERFLMWALRHEDIRDLSLTHSIPDVRILPNR